MIYGVVLGIHVLVCLALVLVVLLQSSKGGGLAGALGGGAENTVFGGRGAATMLSKATTVFGAGFMITSLTLTLLSAGSSRAVRSVVAEEAAQSPLGAPPTGTALPGGSAPIGDAGTAPAGPGLPTDGAVPSGDATPADGAAAPADDAAAGDQ